MPRPGPRPYECVRRAWHSDRHQPMRGSFIQEIFRVVYEIHSSATKKNKEWKEKLPVVVLKAEEIMYSKANSEAEYMDVETLWDRTNDAINTIIRREETTETGELLQPCIEAALILGCTARSASRSQRNNNHRCYLSPNTQEPTSVPPRSQVPDNVTQGGSSHFLPHHSSNPTSSPKFMPYYLGSESCTPITHANNPTTTPHEFPFSSENFPPPGNNNPIFPIEAHPSSNLARVYPLYYGKLQQTTEPQFGFQVPQASISNAASLGTPHVQFSVEPTEKSFLQDLFPRDEAVIASNSMIRGDLSATFENPPEIKCDLSLRLGTISAPYSNAGTRWHREVEDVGSSSSQEGSKSCDLSLRIDNEFCFFPRDNVDDPLESCSSKRSSEGQGLNSEGSSRKRKVPSSDLVVGGHFSQKPKFSQNICFSRMKKPDQ